jgi:WD40 repeat protein
LLVRQNGLLPPRPSKAWQAHDAAVTALAVGRRWLATESEKGGAVWDLGTGNLIARLPDAHSSAYDDIALSADERWLEAPCEHDGWCVWDTNNWQAHRPKVANAPHPNLRFSPDSRRLAVAAYGRDTVEIYDTQSWQKVGDLKHEARAVAWSPDGRWLVTSGWNTMNLWDAVSLEPRGESRDSLSWSLAFDRQGNLAQDRERVPALWAIELERKPTPELIRVAELRPWVSSQLNGRQRLALSPNGDPLATLSGIYELGTLKEQTRIPEGVTSLAFLSQDQLVVLRQRRVEIWPTRAKRPAGWERGPARSVAFSLTAGGWRRPATMASGSTVRPCERCGT